MEAAVERPPHLKAIMPIAGTFDLYESATHHGLMSSGFITPFLYMIGMTSGHTNKLWRSKLMDAMRALLLTPGIHKKFETANGEAAIAGLKVLLKLHHDPHPWDDLWRAIAAEHPFRDAWWEDRNLLPLLDRVEVPVYLGCDWQNVPLHLPHTFTAYERLTNSKHLQVAMMGEHGLAWPWESLHIEALAWFDHWLKGQDTGILEGPHFRYVMPEAEGWRTTDTWPIPEAVHQPYALRADGTLGEDEGEAGSRTYMNLGGWSQSSTCKRDRSSVDSCSGRLRRWRMISTSSVQSSCSWMLLAPRRTQPSSRSCRTWTRATTRPTSPRVIFVPDCERWMKRQSKHGSAGASLPNL